MGKEFVILGLWLSAPPPELGADEHPEAIIRAACVLRDIGAQK